MDGRKKKWMDGWKERKGRCSPLSSTPRLLAKKGRKKGRTAESKAGSKEVMVEGRKYGWMEGWKIKRVNGRKEGSTDGRQAGWNGARKE